MSELYNRDYELLINVSGTVYSITPPLRIQFDITKSGFGGLNKANFKVYNLVETKRLQLVKDREEPNIGKKYIQIAFKCGYKDNMQIVFKGSIQESKNLKQGPDVVTQFSCLDGGFDFINSFTSKTIVNNKNTVNQILKDMPNTNKGKLTNRTELVRPKVLVGNSAKLISETLADDETFFIDEEKLYIIKKDEVLSSFIPVVESYTGLLRTPERASLKTSFDTLMNPKIKVANLCELKSAISPHLNGVYKVETIMYKGDYNGNEWTMNVTGKIAGQYKVLK